MESFVTNNCVFTVWNIDYKLASVYVICIHTEQLVRHILEFLFLPEDIMFWCFDLVTF